MKRLVLFVFLLHFDTSVYGAELFKNQILFKHVRVRVCGGWVGGCVGRMAPPRNRLNGHATGLGHIFTTHRLTMVGLHFQAFSESF